MKNEAWLATERYTTNAVDKEAVELAPDIQIPREETEELAY